MHRLMCERMLLCPGLCKMGLEIVQSGHFAIFCAAPDDTGNIKWQTIAVKAN